MNFTIEELEILKSGLAAIKTLQENGVKIRATSDEIQDLHSRLRDEKNDLEFEANRIV